MKCEVCKGRKFIELEHGLIQVECAECNGTGEMPESEGVKALIIPRQEGESAEVHAAAIEKARELIQTSEGIALFAGETTQPLKEQYFCAKCGICHYKNKKVGRRHLKYQKA